MMKIQLKRGIFARVGAGALLASALTMGCSSTHGANKGTGGTSGPDGVTTGDAGALADGSADGGAPPPLPSACARVGDEIKITSSAGSDTFAIVWDRNHYVVAYSDKATGNGDIYAISLDATGHPMGAPVAVMLTPDMSDLPSLVAVPSGYVVAWQEGPMFKGVYARALDGNLQGIGDGGMVAYTQSTESRPVMSRAPGGVAIAWMDEIAQVKTIEAAILDPMTLKPVAGPKSIGSTHDVAFPWLAGDANSLALLWSDRTTAGTYDVHFADVDATLATHNDVPVRTGQPGDALLGRMIPTSFGFFSAWEDMRADDNQIFMALVDPMGSHMADGLVEEPNSGDANWPNMAWTGSSAGVVYYQWRGSTPQIFMSFVDGHGKRVGGLHDVQVSSTSNTARFPDVVWTGSEFGVAWVDTRDNTPQVYFARVACKQ